MTEIIEKIGPEEAQEYLNTMGPPSYPVDPAEVRRFARDMSLGLWLTVHRGAPVDPLRLTPEGRMISGRRRMLAVIAAGVEIDFIVQRADWDELRRVQLGSK